MGEKGKGREEGEEGKERRKKIEFISNSLIVNFNTNNTTLIIIINS